MTILIKGLGLALAILCLYYIMLLMKNNRHNIK